jgi:hypothetical protein
MEATNVTYTGDASISGDIALSCELQARRFRGSATLETIKDQE